MRINLDRIDLEILKILINNSRASITEIADKLELSRPTVRHRIKKLRETGVIKKFTVLLNENLSGNISTIIGFKARDVNEVINMIRDMEEITEIYVTSGDNNVICKAQFHNMSSLKNFMMRFLENNIPIETSIILETVKRDIGILPQSLFQLTCDYCGKDITDKPYTYILYNRTFNFCCPTCLHDFRRMREDIE
jgi:DNA-binding Lrp family transcriptional regulator